MNPVLTGQEVRQNEEYGGRYHITHSVPRAPGLPGQKDATYWLERTHCHICGNAHRTLEVFADNHTTKMSWWAACGNCGNWDPL